MLEDLEGLLREKGIPFDRKGNRIRCFPHVVNISVQHGLKALTEVEVDPSGRDLAASSDPVKSARRLVAACRASGQRREDFATVIKELNDSGALNAGTKHRPLQLLRDVDTCWSSTFLMIDRLLTLYPAVIKFMEHPKQSDIAHLLLSDSEIQVLQDIREFLHLPHLVQEVLSAEQTPTVSQALPAYERLVKLLKLTAGKYPKISHAINASISALERYMHYTRQTRVYALAMST
ncbi:ribonuclease H-like domain-containing protein [Trametes maxima]|nr:ribonuclease H-like domain-containing protein [Trametes maxima]